MKPNPKKLMVVSGVPGNVARITMSQIDDRTRRGASDEELVDVFRASSDSRALLVPMTEEAYAEACHQIGARPCHPTLADYPAPSR